MVREVDGEGQPAAWKTPSWLPLANGWFHNFPRDRWELWQSGEMVAWIACELMWDMGVKDPAEAVRRMAR